MAAIPRHIQRVNPLREFQVHAFKQFFQNKPPRTVKELKWMMKTGNAVLYQRGAIESMFYRVNALMLALHRHHHPLLLWYAKALF